MRYWNKDNSLLYNNMLHQHNSLMALLSEFSAISLVTLKCNQKLIVRTYRIVLLMKKFKKMNKS